MTSNTSLSMIQKLIATFALTIASGISSAGNYYLEVVRTGETPNGLNEYDAGLFMIESYDLYIWTDIADLRATSLNFSLFTALEGVRMANPTAADLISLGVTDPMNFFETVSGNGRLNSDRSVIDRLTVTRDAPGVVIPTDPADALLLYSGFELAIQRGRGGVRPTAGGTFFVPPGETLNLVELGVYSLPTPGTIVILGAGLLCGTRRSRPSI